VLCVQCTHSVTVTFGSITSHDCGVVMCLVATVCVSVYNALTSESDDLEISLLVCSTSSEYLGQVRMSRSSDQGQGHRSKKYFYILFGVIGI